MFIILLTGVVRGGSKSKTVFFRRLHEYFEVLPERHTCRIFARWGVDPIAGVGGGGNRSAHSARLSHESSDEHRTSNGSIEIC